MNASNSRNTTVAMKLKASVAMAKQKWSDRTTTRAKARATTAVTTIVPPRPHRNERRSEAHTEASAPSPKNAPWLKANCPDTPEHQVEAEAEDREAQPRVQQSVAEAAVDDEADQPDHHHRSRHAGELVAPVDRRPRRGAGRLGAGRVGGRPSQE